METHSFFLDSPPERHDNYQNNRAIVFTGLLVALTYLTYDPGVKHNSLSDTLSFAFMAWVLVGLNMFASRLAKEKNLRDHKIIITLSVVFTVIFGMAGPSLFMFQSFHTPQPYSDMIAMACTVLCSLVVPALVLRMKIVQTPPAKAMLQYGGKIWKCPNCGSLLEKPNNDTWKLVGGSGVVGTATCATCGSGTPIALVYSGKYDV